MKTFKKNRLSMAVATVSLAASATTYAQQIEEVVVSAAAGGRSVLDSSVAVTGVDSDLIKDFQPSSEGEIFRMIPGIQVSGTAGPGGNANIAVRGLPVSTGGSPFIQIQEDGLPTVLFGDIQFGNNDYWTRFDASTRTVEAVRGGTAGVYSSQSPAAIINYVSYTGEEEDGGYVQFNTGLGFDENKIDFRYGGAASDTVNYHVGGFVRNGKGPLDISYGASDSYQIKANLTKHFADDKGYIRFLTKVAETHEANYTGAPALADLGFDGDGNVKSISGIKEFPGFDGRTASNYSKYYRTTTIISRDGGVATVPVDGISTSAFSLGTELQYQFSDNLSMNNKMRVTEQSGTFAAPFLNLVKTDALLDPDAPTVVNGGEVARIVYFNGPNAGMDYDGEYLVTNPNAYTDMRDFGNFANDLVLTGEYEVAGGDLKVRAGYFYMDQTIAMDWHTGDTYKALRNGDDPALLSLYDADDNLLTAEGMGAYNGSWGAKDYDLGYVNTAPYLVLDFENDLFQVDAGYRWENISASGYGQDGGDSFTTTVQALDVLTDTMVDVDIKSAIPNGRRENLDYEESYESWTVGGLWKAAESFSVFARASEGGRFNADRQVLAGSIDAAGELNEKGKTQAVNFVKQYEIGLKNEGEIGTGLYTVEFTLLKGEFNVDTVEINQQVCVTAPTCQKSAEYKSRGFELGATYFWEGLSLTGNATYSDAEEITTISTLPSGGTGWVTAANIPDLTFTISASYEFNEQLSAGINVSGETDVINPARQETDGSETWGANVKYKPVENLELGLNVYNLLDDYSVRGGAFADQPADGVITGGPTLGRTTRASIKVLF